MNSNGPLELREPHFCGCMPSVRVTANVIVDVTSRSSGMPDRELRTATVVSIGYEQIHTTSEFIPIAELVKAAELVEILAAA